MKKELLKSLALICFITSCLLTRIKDNDVIQIILLSSTLTVATGMFFAEWYNFLKEKP